MNDKKGGDSSLAKTEQGGPRTFSELGPLHEAMQKASKNANLIAPIVAIDQVPVFFEWSLRVVKIDSRSMQKGGEVYHVGGGKNALGKSALAKLAHAARITWDGARSGRLDDASDPHYVHFRAVGYFPDYDGRNLLEISGEKILDLRDGSAMVQKLQAESRDSGERRIREMRAFILEHAESKARNRAIRQALSLKSGYTEEELRKPFVVPALVETGRCEDPELRRMYMEKKLEGAGLATRALYGKETPLAPADTQVIDVKAENVKTKPIEEERRPPPPVEDVPYDHDTGDRVDEDDGFEQPF